MTKKEKQIQSALGTMKRQVRVSADLSDVDGIIGEFKEALKNFGLFVYKDPNWEGTSEVELIISNEKLTDGQIEKMGEDFLEEVLGEDE